MTSIIEAVVGRVSTACVGDRIRANNCGASLEGIPSEHIVVDLDCAAPQAKRADYLYAANDGNVAVIELKKGSVDVEDVVDQLQGGANIADKQLLPKGVTVAFRPVLVRGGSGKAKHKGRKRKQNRIRFRGENYDIVAIKCGAQLKTAFR